MIRRLREGRVIPFDRAVRVIEGEQKVLGFSRLGGACSYSLELNEVYKSPLLESEGYSLVKAPSTGGRRGGVERGLLECKAKY